MTPIIPPKARQAIAKVAAVPIKYEGTDRDRAVMGIDVVTAVPKPAREDKASQRPLRLGFTKASNATKTVHQRRAMTRMRRKLFVRDINAPAGKQKEKLKMR